MFRRISSVLILGLISIESLVLGAIFYSRRSNEGISILNSGLSAKNFLIFSLAIFILFIAIGLVIGLIRDRQSIKQLTNFISSGAGINTLALVFLLTLYECTQDLFFFTSDISNTEYYQYYLILLNSLLPFLVWGVLISLKSLILLVVFNTRYQFTLIPRVKDIPRRAVIFSGLLVIGILLHVSGYGFLPNSENPSVSPLTGNFATLRAPLIGVQIIVVILIVIGIYWLLLLIKGFIGSQQQSRIIDIVFMSAIWLVTYTIWVGVPIEDNYFIYITGFHDFPIFPVSDSFYYDKEALSLLLGQGYIANSTHVLYSTFLALLHSIGGSGYLDIIGFQIAFLALIPVALYKLTRTIYNQFSGLLAASLYILRERNALLLAGDVTGSTVNQLMSENLAVLGVILFILLVVQWTKEPERYRHYPFIAGGIVGLTLLIRAEFASALLAVSLFLVVHYWRKRKYWLAGILKIWGITLVIILPWMVRNYYTSGVFSLDKGDYIQRRVTEYIQNISLDEEDLYQDIIDTEPIDQTSRQGYQPRFNNIPNHLTSSIWQGVLYLPSSHQPFLTFKSLPWIESSESAYDKNYFDEDYLIRYVKGLPYFWYSWTGDIDRRSILPVILLLAIIATGISEVWKQHSPSVSILILVYGAYISIWAFAGYSGGRFIKLVDWISLLFFCVGLTSILRNLKMAVIKGSQETENRRYISQVQSYQLFSDRKLLVPILVICIAIGLSPVILEMTIPSKYTVSNLQQIISSEQWSDSVKITNSELGTQNVILYGKALYPLYFTEGETLPDNRRRSIPNSNLSRVDFYIIGTDKIWVSLPQINNTSPISHYSDVVVIGEYVRTSDLDLENGRKPYFLARDVLILEGNEGEQKIHRIRASDDEHLSN